MTAPRIRLIAPSGRPHDQAAIALGIGRLEAAGCTLEGREVLDRAEQRFAGSDAERAADINRLAVAAELPDVALAVRGGYGATRLLEHLHYAALRERLAGRAVALVGHSDFTALQLALYARAGLVTFGGPMLGADFGAPSLDGLMWRHFWHVLGEPVAHAEWASPTPGELALEGMLWGGNLALLASLVGTAYFPQVDGGILFIEDVGEPPYRIERLLYQLHLSGVLARQKALLVGHFTHCHAHDYDAGFDVEAAFAQLARVARLPIVRGLPFGHEPGKFTLPFGVPARLMLGGGQARLTFSGHPHFAATVERPAGAPAQMP